MINEVSLKKYISESLDFLRDVELFKGKGTKAIGAHSEEFKKVSRDNRHTDIYNVAISNQDYENFVSR